MANTQARAYTYKPAELNTSSVSKMRFELGDIDVDGEEQTCMLSDQEIQVVIGMHKNWGRAKLYLVNSVLARLAFETNVSVGGMSVSSTSRYAHWEKLKEELEKKVGRLVIPKPGDGEQSTMYFHQDMQRNNRSAR